VSPWRTPGTTVAASIRRNLTCRGRRRTRVEQTCSSSSSSWWRICELSDSQVLLHEPRELLGDRHHHQQKKNTNNNNRRRTNAAFLYSLDDENEDTRFQLTLRVLQLA
jgi:hypothetical protein